jgi:hypothetical protein
MVEIRNVYNFLIEKPKERNVLGDVRILNDNIKIHLKEGVKVKNTFICYRFGGGGVVGSSKRDNESSVSVWLFSRLNN